MPLAIEKVQEGDIPRLLDIMCAAFHDDPWNRIMFPQVPAAAGRMASTERWRHEMSIGSHICCMKVVDTTNDHEIVALARWYLQG